jgi:hypothetical protein
MAANTDFLDVSELSFDGIKDNLKSYLKQQAIFQGYDFEGTNLNALLDVLSYNTYMNSFYLNMVGSEGFLDSSQIRSSAVSHAKELNYLPRSRTAAHATITATVNVTDGAKYVIIPQYYVFNAFVDNKYLDFTTDSDIVIYPKNGVYISNPFKIYEGKIVTEYFTVAEGTKFILKSENVDTNSIRVEVQKSKTNTQVSIFKKAESLLNVTNSSKVFFLQGYKDNQYEIVFGDGVSGMAVNNGNIVKVTYRSTNGALGNKVATFNPTRKLEELYTIGSVTVDVAAAHGSERESIDSIKFYAPRHYTTQYRAVTRDDYVNLIRERYPEIKAISVYGGEEADPPQYGKVIITMIPRGNIPLINDDLKADIISYLKKYNITTEPIIYDPELVFAEITTNVQYFPSLTQKTETQIKKEIHNQIVKFERENLTNFGNDLRRSKLSSYIDASDVAIASSMTELRSIIRITPIKTTTQKIDISFARPLNRSVKAEYGLNEKNVIKSSNFSYYNPKTNRTYSAYLADDGKGILKIYYLTPRNVVEVLDQNIGTVNYKTGRMIFDLNVYEYINYIEIFAIMASDDITVSNKKYLEIDYSKLTINLQVAQQ